jgi:hypothetical protein
MKDIQIPYLKLFLIVIVLNISLILIAKLSCNDSLSPRLRRWRNIIITHENDPNILILIVTILIAFILSHVSVRTDTTIPKLHDWFGKFGDNLV